MVTIKLYNTLTRTKENFAPLDAEHVKFYACGPTVYNYAHIGNGRMSVVCDQLYRVLQKLFPQVSYASNITDIDDKIIDASISSGVPISEITNKYSKIYNEDMASLGCKKPDFQPRATEYIAQMITLTERLVEKNHAYVVDNHVFFDVSSYPAYGRLSGRTQDALRSGTRVEENTHKRNQSDFVLWKPSSGEQPGWESPWGFGRPGWHLECSVMSEQTLGLPFDIHGGGIDLTFPHHENEIAQSCCSTGHLDDPFAFAKFWFHNGFVTVEGEKMSKSLGNVQLVHDLLNDYRGETLRLALLSTHYRQPLDWTESGLIQARKTLDRLYRSLYEAQAPLPTLTEDTSLPEAFMEALCDDLNTPKAISELCSLSSALAATTDPKEAEKISQQLLAAGAVLGILGEDPASWLGYKTTDGTLPVEEIEALIEERNAARKNRDFARADEIRDELKAMNIELEDKPDGTIWKSSAN